MSAHAFSRDITVALLDRQENAFDLMEAGPDLTQGGSVEHGPNGAAAESGGTSNPYPTPGLAGDLASGPDGTKSDKPSYLSTAPQPELDK